MPAAVVSRAIQKFPKLLRRAHFVEFLGLLEASIMTAQVWLPKSLRKASGTDCFFEPPALLMRSDASHRKVNR